MASLKNPIVSTRKAQFFVLIGWLVVVSLVGFSMWAVALVQFEKTQTKSLTRYWYLGVFLLCEIWAAGGLVFLINHWTSKRRAAFCLALVLWLPALGLSSFQEYVFHQMQVRKKDAEIAPQMVAYNQAKTRLDEVAQQLLALGVQRPSEAIEVELARYTRSPSKYPTKIAVLESELALSKRYEKLSNDQSDIRKSLEDSAHFYARYSEVQKTTPFQHWVLIIWMMVVKAFGAYVISGRDERVIPMKQTAPNTMSQKALDGRPMRVLT